MTRFQGLEKTCLAQKPCNLGLLNESECKLIEKKCVSQVLFYQYILKNFGPNKNRVAARPVYRKVLLQFNCITRFVEPVNTKSSLNLLLFFKYFNHILQIIYENQIQRPVQKPNKNIHTFLLRLGKRFGPVQDTSERQQG